MSAAVAAPPLGGDATEAAMPPPVAVVAMPDSKKNAIFFFGTQGPHGALSNFSTHAFQINDVLWRTVEHYYEAQKFIGTDVETLIRETEDPAEVKKLAKKHEEEKRSDWEEIKEKVMFAALLAKFTQNKPATNALLATKKAFLVEHSKKDSYWGDGHANGLNRLGVLLMEVRSLIRAQLGLPEPTDDDLPTREEEEESAAALKKMLADLMAKSDAIDEGIIATTAPRTKRRIRTRPGNASKPYRSIDGTPIFEKDLETGGVTVIDEGISIPHKSLTPAARTVTFLYQFEKRNRRQANMLEPEDLEEEEEENDEDLELEFQYLPPQKETMDDLIAERALEQLLEETELALVMASSLEDRTSDDFKAFGVQLRTLSAELQKHVDVDHDEATLDHILQTISAIDIMISS